MENKIINLKVTVEYICKNFVDEETLLNDFDGDIIKCYEMVSDNYSESIYNFTDNEKIIKIEKYNE